MKQTFQPDADIDLIGDELEASLAVGSSAKVVGVDSKECKRVFPDLELAKRHLCVEGKDAPLEVGGCFSFRVLESLRFITSFFAYLNLYGLR